MSFDIRDYIVVFEDIAPKELCAEVIQEYATDKNWVNTTTGSGLNRDVRRCDAINISEKFIVDQNYERRNEIDGKIFLCASKAIEKYNIKFNESKIQQDSGYTLLRYQENEYYKQHTDHFLQAPRTVSCSFSLNDAYEGGEWGFFNREVVIKAPKGSAILFPSNFMYPHEIMPVTKGVRYSIVTWFI